MKTKRTVTAKVVAANKRNARRSTGPKTEPGKRAAAVNRRTHGLLSRTVVFASDEERTQYSELLELWRRECDAGDMVEAALIKEIADNQRRLQQIASWESQAVRTRRMSSHYVVTALVEQNQMRIETPDLPIVNDATFRNALAGWECSELSLTSQRPKNVNESTSGVVSSEECDPRGLRREAYEFSRHRHQVPVDDHSRLASRDGTAHPVSYYIVIRYKVRARFSFDLCHNAIYKKSRSPGGSDAWRENGRCKAEEGITKRSHQVLCFH